MEQIGIVQQIATTDAIALADEFARRAKIAQEHLAELRHRHADLKADYALLEAKYKELEAKQRDESAEVAWRRVREREDDLRELQCAYERAKDDLTNVMLGMSKCSVCRRSNYNGDPGLHCHDGCKPEWRDFEGIWRDDG